MKKLIALLMVCGFAMSFIACGGGSEKAEDTEEATEAPAMEPAPSESDTTEVDTTEVQ
jgi:hypothetical protein